MKNFFFPKCFHSVLPLVLLVSCSELFYDPVEAEDTSGTPGERWRGTAAYPAKSVEKPYTPADLSGTMPLSKLLDIALYNNPATRASWSAAKASAYAYRVARSDYYPTVLYSSNLTVEKNTIGASSGSTTTSALPVTPLQNTGITANTTTISSVSDQIDTYFNEVTASWLMFDFGGRDARAELALQVLHAANWQHNYTMQQVMVTVLDAYASYLGNKALVEANQETLEDAQVVLKASQTMRKAGLATMTDELQASSAVELARSNLVQAQGAEKTSFAQLMIAMGLPPETQASIQDLPQQLPVIEIAANVNAFLELARHKRPDIGVAIAAVKQQEAALAISYSSSMPVFTADAMLSRLHFIHRPSKDGYDNNLSINLNFPLFQGFYYVNQQKQIRAQIQEALANLDVQLSNVATQVVNSYYTFTTAVGILPSSQANLEFAERAFKGYLVQYKVGTASVLNLLNALTTLSSARAQLVITRTQWAASLANLAFAVGILEEDSGSWQEGDSQVFSKPPFENNQPNQGSGHGLCK